MRFVWETFTEVVHNPARAVAMSTVFWCLFCSVRFYLFRKHLEGPLFRRMLAPSMVGAAAGTLIFLSFAKHLPPETFAALGVVVLPYFVGRRLGWWGKLKRRKVTARRHPLVAFLQTLHLGERGIALLSGFMQGMPASGGNLRDSWFAARGVTLYQMYASSSAVAIGNFLVAGSIMGAFGVLTPLDAMLVLTTTPLVLMGVIVLKRVLDMVGEQMRELFFVASLATAWFLLVINVL